MTKSQNQVLILCGDNDSSVLGENTNTIKRNGRLIICPPIKSNFKVSTISSFSVYSDHSVLITEDGEVFGSGDNLDHKIIKSLPHEELRKFTKFDIKTSKNQKVHPISAFCGTDFTLYMVLTPKKLGEKVTLAYTYSDIKTVSPLFLNIGDKRPVTIYGGFSAAAAIIDDGSVLYIPNLYQKLSTLQLESVRLPSNESAVCLSVCNDFIFAVDLRGRLFQSKRPVKESKLDFYVVESLKNEKIEEINGIMNHCFAVTVDGRVFGHGLNEKGMLGIGKYIEKVDEFREISSLHSHKIKHAYAGHNHSLFVTVDGKVFACGDNSLGQLLLPQPSNEKIYLPVETEIKSGAVFCVVGYAISAVFIGIDPQNSPNHRIDTTKLATEITISSLLLHSSSSSESIEDDDDEKSEDETKKVANKRGQKIEVTNRPYKTKNDRKKRTDFSADKDDKLVSISSDEVERLKAELAAVKRENGFLRSRLDDKSVHKDQSPKATLEILAQDSISSIKRCEVIGRGSQSEVIKVTREFDFALKILRINAADSMNPSQTKPSDMEKLKKLLNEYEIITSLHHPNIIETYGFCFGDSINPPSILLQFCPHNLQEAISNMTEIEKVCSIYEISLGMAAVHEAGLIHRDLKPASILIDRHKHVRVSDFGISCIENKNVSMSTVFGAFNFMAPELTNRSRHYSNKVDVYSFGVIVFFILTGGEMPQISLPEQLSGKKAPIPKKINKVSRDLITRCWSTVPEQRPSFSEICEFIKCNKFGLIDGVEKEIKSIRSFLYI